MGGTMAIRYKDTPQGAHELLLDLEQRVIALEAVHAALYKAATSIAELEKRIDELENKLSIVASRTHPFV